MGSEYCKDCVYSSTLTVAGAGRKSEICCLYILAEYEPRGCEAGEKCTKKKIGKKKKNQIAYSKEVWE